MNSLYMELLISANSSQTNARMSFAEPRILQQNVAGDCTGTINI